MTDWNKALSMTTWSSWTDEPININQNIFLFPREQKIEFDLKVTLSLHDSLLINLKVYDLDKIKITKFQQQLTKNNRLKNIFLLYKNIRNIFQYYFMNKQGFYLTKEGVVGFTYDLNGKMGKQTVSEQIVLNRQNYIFGQQTLLYKLIQVRQFDKKKRKNLESNIFFNPNRFDFNEKILTDSQSSNSSSIVCGDLKDSTSTKQPSIFENKLKELIGQPIKKQQKASSIKKENSQQLSGWNKLSEQDSSKPLFSFNNSKFRDLFFFQSSNENKGPTLNFGTNSNKESCLTNIQPLQDKIKFNPVQSSQQCKKPLSTSAQANNIKSEQDSTNLLANLPSKNPFFLTGKNKISTDKPNSNLSSSPPKINPFLSYFDSSSTRKLNPLVSTYNKNLSAQNSRLGSTIQQGHHQKKIVEQQLKQQQQDITTKEKQELNKDNLSRDNSDAEEEDPKPIKQSSSSSNNESQQQSIDPFEEASRIKILGAKINADQIL